MDGRKIVSRTDGRIAGKTGVSTASKIVVKTGRRIGERIVVPTPVVNFGDLIGLTRLPANMAGKAETMRARLRWTGHIEWNRLRGRNVPSVRKDPSVRNVLRSLNGLVDTEACPSRMR